MSGSEQKNQATLARYLRSLENRYDQQKNQAIQKLLRGSLAGKRVLDLGCGAGAFSIWFGQQNAQVIGIDRDADKVGAARLYAQRAGIAKRASFICADVCALDLAKSFDFIFAKDIVEHVDDQRFMQVIAKWMRPQARLLLSTHNSWSLQYLLAATASKFLGKGPYLGTDPSHLRMYSPKSLQALLRTHGFLPRHWLGCYHLPYRLLQGLVPMPMLERKSFHLIENSFGHKWPFDRTGWSLTVLAEMRTSGNNPR